MDQVRRLESRGLGHTKLESTVRYLGIEVDDALRSRSRLRSSIQVKPRSVTLQRVRTGHELPVAVTLQFADRDRHFQANPSTSGWQKIG
jgi:hypothetical protein